MRQPTQKEIEVAKAMYLRRTGLDAVTIAEHFRWFFEFAGDPMSSVHVSNVANCLKDARAAIRAMPTLSAEQTAVIMNLDGPLSRGEIHPAEFYAALIDAASPQENEE